MVSTSKDKLFSESIIRYKGCQEFILQIQITVILLQILKNIDLSLNIMLKLQSCDHCHSSQIIVLTHRQITDLPTKNKSIFLDSQTFRFVTAPILQESFISTIFFKSKSPYFGPSITRFDYIRFNRQTKLTYSNNIYMNSNNILNCSLSVLHQTQSILKYSGLGAFRKGQYQDCVETPQMKYSLVSLGVNGSGSFLFTGLCVPQKCTDTLITKQLDNLLSIAHTPLSVTSIYSHPEQYSFDFNWMSYLTITILVILAILALIATFKARLNQRTPNKILMCFDLVSNTKNIFKVRQGEPLNIIDGVRAISMMWVVIGHFFSFLLSSGIVNTADYTAQVQQPFFLVIIMGFISVDIFYCLGGFFLAFVVLRQKKITAKLCLSGILHRVLRIWPAYIFTMMFYASVFMRLGSGSFWNKVQNTIQNCGSMWMQILFISNLIDNGSHQCMSWGGYLQVQFQLFAFGLLFLYIYSKKRNAFLFITILLSVLSTIANYVYTYHIDLRLLTDLEAFSSFGDYLTYFYAKPYGRCPPYLMGLILGVYYMEYRIQLKKQNEEATSIFFRVRQKFIGNYQMRRFVQWSGIAIMAFLTFIPRPLQTGSKWPQFVHSLYWALSKPLFIVGIFMTIMPTMLGLKKSFFNLILNSNMLMIMARISFCTYLCHLMVVYQWIYVKNYDFYFDVGGVFVVYVGILILCLVFGYLMTVLIEVPCANCIRLLTKREVKKQIEADLTEKQSLIQ